MDPRIGILTRDGAQVFYAFVQGYARPPVEGSLASVERALGVRTSRDAAKRRREFIVTMAFRNDAKFRDEITVWATNHADAIAQARAWRSEHHGPAHTGYFAPCTFRARLASGSKAELNDEDE